MKINEEGGLIKDRDGGEDREKERERKREKENERESRKGVRIWKIRGCGVRESVRGGGAEVKVRVGVEWRNRGGIWEI